MNWKEKKINPLFFVFFFSCPLKCLLFENLAGASVIPLTLFGGLSSISLSLSVSTHFPDLSNNALTIKTKKAALQPQLLSLSFIKKGRRSPDGDGSMCLFVSLTQDFRYNSLPVYPSFPSSSDVKRDGGCGRGRGWLFSFFFLTVINTCTQSFNLPYLSHVTV